MWFLWSNKAFDGRVSQKAFGFAAVRERERENNALLPLRKRRAHVMELSRKRSFTLPGRRCQKVKDKSLNRTGSVEGQIVKNILLTQAAPEPWLKSDGYCKRKGKWCPYDVRTGILNCTH